MVTIMYDALCLRGLPTRVSCTRLGVRVVCKACLAQHVAHLHRQAGSLSNGDTAGSTGLGGLGEAPYANLTQLHKVQMGGGGNFSIQNETEFPALPGASEARGSEDGQPGAPGPQQAGQQQQVCTCSACCAEIYAWQLTVCGVPRQ